MTALVVFDKNNISAHIFGIKAPCQISKTYFIFGYIVLTYRSYWHTLNWVRGGTFSHARSERGNTRKGCRKKMHFFTFLLIVLYDISFHYRLVKVYQFWAFMDRSERHTNYPNLLRFVLYYLILQMWSFKSICGTIFGHFWSPSPDIVMSTFGIPPNSSVSTWFVNAPLQI